MRKTLNQPISLMLRRLIIVVVYFAYLQPAYLDHFLGFSIFFNLVRIITFIFLIFYYALCKRVSRLFVYTTAYTSITFLMTQLQRGDVIKGFRLIVIVLGVMLWSDYLGRKCPQDALNILDILLTVILFVNYFTIILYPNGLYQYTTEIGWSSNEVWLLGLRNAHIKYLGLGCFCSGVKFYYSSRKVRDIFRVILVHGIIILTVFELKSGGGFVMLSAYYLMLVLVLICFRNIRIDFSLGIIFHVVLFVLTTLLSATMLFSGFFELFGKDGTATGRIALWAAVWSHIFEKPILGHGYMFAKDLRWMRFLAAGATTGHNVMIDMVFQGGLLTLLCFILLLFEVRERLSRISHHIIIYNYAVIAFVAFFLIMQSEGGMDSAVLFLMIGMLSILPGIHVAETRKRETAMFQYTNRLHIHTIGAK